MLVSSLLIAVGLVIIILSYNISEKITENNMNADGKTPLLDEEAMDRILKENEEKFKKSTETILDEKMEEEIGRVDDQLSHLSNEKIMAVSELSDQILEKIEQNHKEVVFLYDMLNEKENEMKEFVQEIDKSKIVLEELAEKELERQKALQHKKIQQELERERKKQERLAREKEELLKSRVIQEQKQQEENTVQITEVPNQAVLSESQKQEEKPVSALEKMGSIVEKPVSQLEQMGNTVEKSVSALEQMESTVEKQVSALEQIENVSESVHVVTEEIKQPVEEKPEPAYVSDNQNQVILDLYNEGKTIMEIAKMLGKGQGEVKLVIDLFQGAKK